MKQTPRDVPKGYVAAGILCMPCACCRFRWVVLTHVSNGNNKPDFAFNKSVPRFEGLVRLPSPLSPLFCLALSICQRPTLWGLECTEVALLSPHLLPSSVDIPVGSLNRCRCLPVSTAHSPYTSALYNAAFSQMAPQVFPRSLTRFSRTHFAPPYWSPSSSSSS